LEFHAQVAKRASVIAYKQFFRPVPLALMLVLGGLGVAVYAQIEGGDRGVAPIDSSSSFEVSGISVDVAAKSADAARFGGWRVAQRKGWQQLWQRINGGGAPGLSDSQLDGIVAGIEVESEQIGPTRYIAKLGVLFDRARAGQILGVSGQIVRSPPMLVIPIQWSGGSGQVFETKTDWQKAWARFKSGASPIDYVRPSGSGSDPMLLNVAQTGRPGRKWWRFLLDQYGSADVLIPQVQLQRMWPGGPVVGRFTAYHGPDRNFVGSFNLRVESSANIGEMMDEGVKRIDQMYSDALSNGRLRADPSLVIEAPVAPEDLRPAGEGVTAQETVASEEDAPTTATAETTQISVQFDTPDVAAVGATEAAVKAVPGVKSANTTSLALGGTSVMKVNMLGDSSMLRIALQARGFKVEEGSGVLRIRRAASRPAASPGEDTGQ
jgi:hypothetical protein